MGGIGGVVLAVGMSQDKDIEWIDYDYEIEYLEMVLRFVSYLRLLFLHLSKCTPNIPRSLAPP